MARKSPTSLSGDKAYELFLSSSQHPIQDFLLAWKADEFQAEPEYIQAVVGAYHQMLVRCHDGRYGGRIRVR